MGLSEDERSGRRGGRCFTGIEYEANSEARDALQTTQILTIEGARFSFLSDELATEGMETATRHVELSGSIAWDGEGFSVVIDGCQSDDVDFCDSFPPGRNVYGCLKADGALITFHWFRDGPIDCSREAFVRQ
jgi:hypothetical protein